jgi:hypothetical protein
MHQDSHKVMPPTVVQVHNNLHLKCCMPDGQAAWSTSQQLPVALIAAPKQAHVQRQATITRKRAPTSKMH